MTNPNVDNTDGAGAVGDEQRPSTDDKHAVQQMLAMLAQQQLPVASTDRPAMAVDLAATTQKADQDTARLVRATRCAAHVEL